MIYQVGKTLSGRLYFIKSNLFCADMENNSKNHITEVWPGPMEGVMKNAFIQTVTKLDLVSRWMTPFYRVTTHVPKAKQLDEFLKPFLDTNLPVSGQIMGTNARLLGETAILMLKAGCCEVNLNCGCPSQRVVSGNAGGGMLKNIPSLAYILKYLRDTLPVGKFSVKSRIGYDSDQSAEIIQTIIENGNPDRLTIHCRTVKEMYHPVQDMQKRFDKTADLTSEARKKGMVLIFNGDINTVEDAERLTEKYPGCGIMCARSWMNDPGLLKRIEGKSVPDKQILKKQFFETFCSINPAAGATLEIARMLWGGNSDEFRNLLKK